MAIDSPELEHLGFTKIPSTILDNFGALYKTYIIWQNNKQALSVEEVKLKRWIIEFKLLSDQSSLNWIVDWVNAQEDIKQTTLKTFWKGSSITKNLVIDKAYSKDGARRVFKFLHEINKALPGHLNINYQEDIFKTWYNTERLNAWYNFILYFHRGTETLNYKTEWDSIYNPDVILLTKGPYYHLLDVLMTEFGATKRKSSPSWIKQVENFYSLLDFQVKHKSVDNYKDVASVTLRFIDTIVEKPSDISRRGALGGLYRSDFNVDLRAANAFVQYQIDLEKLFVSNVDSIGQSYKSIWSVYDSAVS